MNGQQPRRLFVVLSRFVLGVVFVVAAVDKIAVPEVFAISIEAYRLIPVSLVNIFALVVPWIELLCGVFIIAGVRQRACALILSALLALFIGAIFSAMARDLKIDCGCFGAAHASPVGWPKIAEDAGLLLLALFVYRKSLPAEIPADAFPEAQ